MPGDVGPKLIEVSDDPKSRLLLFWCPGCDEHHSVSIGAPNSMGAVWSWDGNIEAPTFSPSVLVRHKDQNNVVVNTCHLFVRAGHIQYLPDCTHALAGTTVAMEDLT